MTNRLFVEDVQNIINNSYRKMNKKLFTSGKQFYFTNTGKEYEHFFFNRTNNYLMSMLGIEVYLVTKITSLGYYYRGFCRLKEQYHPTDLFMPFKHLKTLNHE